MARASQPENKVVFPLKYFVRCINYFFLVSCMFSLVLPDQSKSTGVCVSACNQYIANSSYQVRCIG